MNHTTFALKQLHLIHCKLKHKQNLSRLIFLDKNNYVSHAPRPVKDYYQANGYILNSFKLAAFNRQKGTLKVYKYFDINEKDLNQKNFGRKPQPVFHSYALL